METFASLTHWIDLVELSHRSGKRLWKLENSRLSYIKSFFTYLFCTCNLPPFPSINFIWKSKTPKIEAFVWATNLGAINTSKRLQIRRPNIALYICVLCYSGNETLDRHLLLHYLIAWSLCLRLFLIFGE